MPWRRRRPPETHDELLDRAIENSERLLKNAEDVAAALADLRRAKKQLPKDTDG